MSRYSTPETRSYARDKAEVIGAAERVIYGEIWDRMVRVAQSRATPAVLVAGFFGLSGLAVGLVESINL